MKVQVLLSTYNGEKYLESLIDTILNQEDVDVSLLVRDDGSSDSTRSILRRIRQRDQRLSYIFESNIGVKKSFLRLVQMANPAYDYFAFADQDDLWKKDKLAAAVAILDRESVDSQTPLIYGSPVYLYSNDNVIGRQFDCPQLSLGNFLVKNYFPGCTMVFNRQLKLLIDMIDISKLNAFPLHDHWLNLVCTACGGKVVVDNEPHIFYRQHETNVVGDRTFLQKVIGNGLFSKSENIRLRICSELDLMYKDFEDEHSRQLITLVRDYQHGVRRRLALAANREIKPTSVLEKLVIILIVLLGKF